MKNINIVNPTAGQGKAESYINKDIEAETYLTSFAGDAEEYIKKRCDAAEETHYYVYGGDGTLNEAINGVLKSENPASATVTPCAAGTGNDFIRSVKDTGRTVCDAMKVNGRFAVNLINIGFDSLCAKRASRYKKYPLVSGTMAFILGVVRTLLGKLGETLQVLYVDENGNEGFLEGDFLLCAVGNGRYYGGGFQATPAASLTDGILDLIIVDKITRRRFISLVGDYKKGSHVTAEGKVIPKFADIVRYIKCKSVRISNVRDVCVDGEPLENEPTLEISVVPKAITVEA